MRSLRSVLSGLASLALLSFFCFAGCSSPQPQPEKPASAGWKIIGPGGGGGIFLATMNPHDPDNCLVYCDMTGAYVTDDGGDNWSYFSLWTVAQDFEFDPGEPNTVYAATRGYPYSEDRGSGLSLLYRSEDRGRHWRIVYPDVGKTIIHEKLQARNLSPSQIVEGAFDANIQKIEVDPADSRRIYLGLTPLVGYIGGGSQKIKETSSLVLSTDRGKSWRLVAEVPGRNVCAILPGSMVGAAGEAIVITDKACVRVKESSGSVTRLPLPVERVTDAAGGTTKDQGTLIYIVSPMERLPDGKIRGGIYRSADWGESWTQVNEGLLEGVPSDKFPRLRGLGICETRPEVVYISANNRGADKTSWFYGVFKTENAGESWHGSLLSNTDGYLTENYTGGWMDRCYDPGWGGNPITIGVAPSNPDIAIGSDAGRAYKTTDGGRTWDQIYSRDLPDSTFTTTGLDVTTCYAVHFDPFDKNHFFISYTDMGLFHTHNSGKSWLHSIIGVPRSWVNTCYWLEFDPQVRDRVWSVWGNAHDLPRDKMFGPGGFKRNQGGVAVSDDGGLNWRKSGEGIPDNSVGTHVLIDPASPTDSRILYTCVFGRGVYKSADGGGTWSEANNGLGDNRYAWQIRREPAQGRLFLLLTRGRKVERSSGRRSVATVDGELYTSDDKAASWQPLALPDGINAPHDLLIDPAEPQRMYLSCWACAGRDGDVNGGLYRTEDGGKTWKQVFDEVMRVNAADLDPHKPGTVYINTFHNAAFRSDDRGETWRRLEGYRAKWGQRPVPDPRNEGMIFLTTYGGSVFYGPAEGVPGAFEAVENMPESWW